jgi:hypothetical protein
LIEKQVEEKMGGGKMFLWQRRFLVDFAFVS